MAMDFRTRLRLFNQKAEKLLASTFQRSLADGLTAEMSWTSGGEWTSSFRGPHDEAIDAAVLTLRQFIQNNDPISIGNIRRAYAAATISDADGNQILQICDQLNAFLDQPSPIALPSGVLTHRALLSTYVYGDLAHSNDAHRDNYEALAGSVFSDAVAKMEFVSVMGVVCRVVKLIARINERHLAGGAQM